MQTRALLPAQLLPAPEQRRAELIAVAQRDIHLQLQRIEGSLMVANHADQLGDRFHARGLLDARQLFFREVGLGQISFLQSGGGRAGIDPLRLNRLPDPGGHHVEL